MVWYAMVRPCMVSPPRANLRRSAFYLFPHWAGEGTPGCRHTGTLDAPHPGVQPPPPLCEKTKNNAVVVFCALH